MELEPSTGVSFITSINGNTKKLNTQSELKLWLEIAKKNPSAINHLVSADIKLGCIVTYTNLPEKVWWSY